MDRSRHIAPFLKGGGRHPKKSSQLNFPTLFFLLSPPNILHGSEKVGGGTSKLNHIFVKLRKILCCAKVRERRRQRAAPFPLMLRACDWKTKRKAEYFFDKYHAKLSADLTVLNLRWRWCVSCVFIFIMRRIYNVRCLWHECLKLV